MFEEEETVDLDKQKSEDEQNEHRNNAGRGSVELRPNSEGIDPHQWFVHHRSIHKYFIFLAGHVFDHFAG